MNTSNGYWGGGRGLARFDDPGWTVFGEADGVEPWGAQGFIATAQLEVAPDGSLWMNGATDEDGCGGVAHYDGTTWTSSLRPYCVHDLSVAPDGSVFVRADLEQVSWGGLFVEGRPLRHHPRGRGGGRVAAHDGTIRSLDDS